MPSSTVENYLKQLYLEEQSSPGQLVSMGRLAALMNVVPGTVTTMVKTLADSGLVAYEPRGGVRLTPNGNQLALHVLRRHRLVELFLVKILGLDWSEVHDEAEELEHAISDKVLERMDALLEKPSVDPHGDPIPSAALHVEDLLLPSLADCPLNTPQRIARILDQNAAFLQFLHRSGLTPGTPLQVLQRHPHADAVLLQTIPPADAPITLGTPAAAKILVEPLPTQ